MRCWHEAGFRHHWRRFAPAFTGAPWHARLWGVRNRAAIQNWMPWHGLTSSSASRMGSVVSIKVALSLRRSLEAEGSILWLWPSARIGMSRDEEWMWCAWWDIKNTKNTTDLDVFFIHQLLLLLLNPSELNLKFCVFTWDPVILQSGGALQTTFDGLVGMTRRGISSHVSSFGWAQVQIAGSFHQLLDWIVGESQRCDFTTADVVAMELSWNISAYYAQCLSINLLWHVCHQWLPILGVIIWSDHFWEWPPGLAANGWPRLLQLPCCSHHHGALLGWLFEAKQMCQDVLGDIAIYYRYYDIFIPMGGMFEYVCICHPQKGVL